MTTLTNYTDLKYQIDDKEVFNDIRVIMFHYAWDADLTTVPPYTFYPIDLQYVASDTDSINRYGRRTKLLKQAVPNINYGQPCCESNLDKFKEPMAITKTSFIGDNDTITAQCLGFDISEQYTLVDTTMGLNDTFWVDRMSLEVNFITRVPKLTLNLTEARALELLELFKVDAGHIDGPEVIG